MVATHLFLDSDYTSGVKFRTAYLISPAVQADALKILAQKGYKSGGKTNRAFGIWSAVSRGVLTAEQVMSAIAAQTGRYLALRKGSCTVRSVGDAVGLLENFGAGGWHGPLPHPDPARPEKLYVYTQKVEDVWQAAKASPAMPQRRFYRWTITAWVSEEAATFHWHGFSHGTRMNDQGEQVLEQFPFWDYVDDAIDNLALALDATWAPVHLPNLVYKKLWNLFEDDPDHTWRHIDVNAERDGVAFDAASSPAVKSAALDLDLGGLRALTKRLARAVVKSSDYDLEHEQDKYERSLLKTMIQECGTKSYAFSVGRKGANRLAHMRFYMGTEARKGKRRPQHVLAHVLCYLEAGGTVRGAEFLLKHI